jgi:hypothetical protein
MLHPCALASQRAHPAWDPYPPAPPRRLDYPGGRRDEISGGNGGGSGGNGGGGGGTGGWLEAHLRQRFTARFCRLTRNNACADLRRLAELDG